MLSHTKIKGLLQDAEQTAERNGISAHFVPYVYGDGLQISGIDIQRGDLDNFLIELTQMADETNCGLQLALPASNPLVKQQFQRFGFHSLSDIGDLQMERQPNHPIEMQDLDVASQVQQSPTQRRL
jgi:hypothetical protein